MDAGFPKAPPADTEQIKRKRNKDPEICEPELENGWPAKLGVVHNPTAVPLQHGCSAKIIADRPDEESGWKKCARDQDRNVPAHWRVAAEKQADENSREGEKSVHMEQRHRRINGKLGPEWQGPMMSPGQARPGSSFNRRRSTRRRRRMEGAGRPS